MKRDEILDEAKRLTTGDRQADYGDASESFAKVGIVWGVILDTPAIDPAAVALMMSALKIIRATESPTKADNWVDLAGYAALGREIAGAVTPGGEAEKADRLLKATQARIEAEAEPERCVHRAPAEGLNNISGSRCVLAWGHGVDHVTAVGQRWTF